MMVKVPFTVSARTARLIGRENVSNATGAVIELVKNSYDADSNNCILFFDNKYHAVPEYLSELDFLNLSSESDLLNECYYLGPDGDYLLKESLGDIVNNLYSFFRNRCVLYIIDNGSGMTDYIIKNHWMRIGTDNKDTDAISDFGRVKTGAKGIGRFALDRLGKSCELYTLPKGEKDGFLWEVNWLDFEKPNLSIDEVSADLSPVSNLDLKATVASFTAHYEPVNSLIEKTDFNSGTVIKINSLSDDWDDFFVNKVFSSLEALIPPKEMSSFKIHLFSSLQSDKYGEVSSERCDDFDYKVSAEYLDDESKTVIIKIIRNEFDLDKIKKDYSEVFDLKWMKSPPYDFDTLKNKEFEIKTTLYKLVPGFKNVDENNILDDIGKFSFTFYYLKNQVASKERKYPYKSFNSKFRKDWLNRFGGVKLFRDDFRIRPYGERGNDWLLLGDRAAQSPSSAGQVLGGYRIRPHQISGFIKISRLANKSFQDKSGREGIQENDAFNLFKEILVGIIGVFETDRNTIMYSFNELDKKTKAAREQVAKKAVAALLEAQEKNTPDSSTSTEDSGSITSTVDSEHESFGEDSLDSKIQIVVDVLNSSETVSDEIESELRISRSFASSGLIVASFAHDFERFSRYAELRCEVLRKCLSIYLDCNDFESVPYKENPFHQINRMEYQDSKILKWLNFSLTTLTKNRRERSNLDINEYFKDLKEMWEELLQDRTVSLIIRPEHGKCIFRAFQIDLDSIFSNLIANSIDSFKKDGSSTDRIIEITWEVVDEELVFLYQDNGAGLSSDYEDPMIIFNALESSKRDKHGNKTGTGLGMWIVKNIVDEYNGRINLRTPEKGFEIELVLPLTKHIGVSYE